jgi:hypothetical protein
MIKKYLLGSDSTDTFIRIIVVLSLLFSGVASVSAARTQVHQGRLSNCVATWADDFTVATTARQVANSSRLDALNKLLLDALATPGTQKANAAQEAMLLDVSKGDFAATSKDAAVFLKQLQINRHDPMLIADVLAYQQSQADYQTTVAAHPLPDPPREVC